ncbi:MmpS family transport accessory protein [Actinosynnema sp. NPDC047251]|uniref:Putative membrane protein n=1 Tax=Saccharothrix espanaensis (strain ATCC 51144 / DSM 44229 / JCM 9112 / NBRC 15066 / NRRL 15764) TaxID=1179773 RepID=K0K4K9_SACES|nr:MmpS family transport accessory protein [Saccharothrix espanaensis]CCH35190.1 putative membrane protein [Saccharothrix espanaensis DSM 44229]
MALPQPPTTQHHQHAAPAPPRNGFGIAGFVLGLLGLATSFVPLIGVVAWPLVILGLVLGGVGIARARRSGGKGLAVAGVVLSAAGLVVCVLWVAVFSQALSDATPQLNDLKGQAGKESRVVYEISGTAARASATYTTYSGGDSSSNKEEITKLPWTKEVTVTGLLSGAGLAAMTGPEGGSVTCKISVDGVEKKTATATGASAVAACNF